MSPSNGFINSGEASSSSCNGNYIEHQVSKMDTLAGVAIKYGVEVADIKRLNGLATDLQMFALKKLQIPLPGRHPPSPNLSNGAAPSPGMMCFLDDDSTIGMWDTLAAASIYYIIKWLNLAFHSDRHSLLHYRRTDVGLNSQCLQGLKLNAFSFFIPCCENSIKKTPPRLSYSNLLESFESLRIKSSELKVSSATSTQVSPAMNNLQKYYGLKAPNHKSASEGMEMAVYKTRSLDCFDDDGLLLKASPISDPLSNRHKSRNLANGFLDENSAVGDYLALAEAGDGEGEKSNEKSVRRRQKSEAESRVFTPEKLLKEENGGGSSGYSAVTGKGLAMRPKSASRTSLATDSDSGWLNTIPVGLGDSILTDGLLGVRKSSSTPSFQDQDNSSSSLWPTSKWSLKSDLQALSTVAITRPIFDGLPKPISGRRSKAALD
ncbi:hypothetical protein JRO89_XS13G0237400 [Xanthoceras sorbifolium]|uniref:LysM domain-containing protein n=1 Tax=Xanthoceras sorbifolium TaxID=99658 RepID=A0ABQ8H9R8_9ROSI|nr:hypothetical protein JRO89_XS13G0237400 [Xanthoceras sorbifolium]